jgi:hypothetical protein
MEIQDTMQQTEAFRHQARLAAEEFEKNRWNVRVVKPAQYTLFAESELSIICGDGRYTHLFRDGILQSQQTTALFGGGYALLELKFGGTEQGLRDAVAFAGDRHISLRLHGDTHGEHHADAPFNCGNLGKWETGAIPGVKPLEITPQQMLDAATSLNIPLDILPGSHEETELFMNYAPGTSLLSSVRRFRTDAWIAHYLGLPDVAAFSRQTVELLGSVRDVTIIEP